jgi:hypothetical protein
MAHDPFRMRPDWDLTRFRYLLVATPRPSLAAAVTFALQDDATLLAAAGDWYLFESRLALAPIDANDAPLPTPHPASLRKKLRELAAGREWVAPPANSPTEP